MDLATVKFIGDVATPVLLFGLGVGLTMAVWYLKKLDGSIDKRFDKLDAEIEKLEDRRGEVRQELDGKITKVGHDLMDLKAALPLKFITRDEYIRQITIMENKIDALGRALGAVSTDIAGHGELLKSIAETIKHESGA